jgi:prepilin-type N-terminal cleavage/methylation domain-containing protein
MKRRRHGFTVMEVMIAIAVMTVGSMAIVGMQVQAQRQNQLAREYLIATQFAQTWSERLKLDALLWTQVAVLNGNPTVAQVLQNTNYLGDLIGTGAAFMPITPAPVGFHKPGATHQGYDIPGTSGLNYPDPLNATATRGHSFCADVRLAWVYFGRTLRADVRVYWPKPGIVVSAPFTGCSDLPDALRPGTGPEVDNYHVVYLPNVLRVTELRP